uniref:(northern house mosquito) hypothetical protein n=3 Tax=Culex pipiens TaxID=7175 RepID=A0A8D8MNJ7_CULPI
MSFNKMGQEKSLPSRCTSAHDYHHHHHHHHHHHTTSLASSTGSKSSAAPSRSPSTASTTSSASSASAASSYKSVERQTKYLNEHLYIKSYLDIEEEDRNAKLLFQKVRPGGIRNYTPKILSENNKKNIDVWI